MTKKCFKCGVWKELDQFYPHPQMGDGHLNKCIECNKADSKRDYDRKIKDPKFIDSERRRGREKYRKYRYKSSATIMSRMKWIDKFPEKKAASQHTHGIKVADGCQKHHWSYNKEHWKDIIPLTIAAHRKAHRFLVYDQERMMYRSLDGRLLDTRERHYAYIVDKIKNEAD